MTAIDAGLIDKLNALPPHRVAEVADFVDFLRMREEEQRLTQAAARMADKSFAQAWDNEADAAYDQM